MSDSTERELESKKAGDPRVIDPLHEEALNELSPNSGKVNKQAKPDEKAPDMTFYELAIIEQHRNGRGQTAKLSSCSFLTRALPI